MITYRGKKGFLGVFPVMAELLAAFDLAGLQGEIAGLLELTVTFTPPSAAAALEVVAAVTAALNAGFQPPAVDFKADLLAKLGLLQAKLELILAITELVASGSVGLYDFDGQAGNLGPELGNKLGGPEADGGIEPTEPTFAVVLLAGGSSLSLLKKLRGLL